MSLLNINICIVNINKIILKQQTIYDNNNEMNTSSTFEFV